MPLAEITEKQHSLVRFLTFIATIEENVIAMFVQGWSMKNNQVYLDPENVDSSMHQLERFYRLDQKTLQMLRRVVQRYPRGVLVYVDEANAQSMMLSPLDDLFTFNGETGELVLFSADATTFINGLIEMWMYVVGFDTMMGGTDHWKVEFAIGAWKPIRDNLKRQLDIPVHHQVMVEVGQPPDPQDALPDDPYPFKTLVSTFNIIAFTQMIRFAGRDDVKVHFPPGTDPRVIETYYTMRSAMKAVSAGLGIEDVEEFNRRLHHRVQQIHDQYHPDTLPMPQGWEFLEDGHEAASDYDDNPENANNIMLGPTDDDSPIGQLPPPSSWGQRKTPKSQREVDQKLEQGPFGQFIDKLFED